jgi:hypothetical protein
MIAGAPIAVVPVATALILQTPTFTGSFCVIIISSFVPGIEQSDEFLAGPDITEVYMAGPEQHGSC